MKEKVSIVIIARNEEENIARCIEAARKAAREIGGAEIILSDSASSDKTVEIALEKGAKVLCLKPEWELSASAGRYIGTHYATGEYILFVDADTLVYEGFLPQAFAALENDEKLAGVCGFLDDSVDDSENLLVFEDRSEEIKDVKWLRGGCCFYRRKAVLEVGSFNPYLIEEEEADIGLRLKRGGWNLQMLPIPMARHTRCMEDLSGKNILKLYIRSRLEGRIGGSTRTLAYAFKNGYGLEFCILRLPTAIFFTIWLLLVVILTILPPSLFHVAAFVIFFLGFIAARIAKGSIKKTLLFFTVKFMYCIDLLLGIPKVKFTPTSEYPLDAEILENKKDGKITDSENFGEISLYDVNQGNTALKLSC